MRNRKSSYFIGGGASMVNFAVHVFGSFVVVIFWKKLLDRLAVPFSLIVILIDKKLTELENWLSQPADIMEEARPQEGVLCPQCEEEWLKSGYSPPYGSSNEDSSRTHDVACVQCHAAIPRKC